MPAFAPGDLDNMIGYTFPVGTFVGFEFFDSANPATGDLKIDNSYYDNAVIANVPGVVSAVDTTYTPGIAGVDTNTSTFPTFGSIVITSGSNTFTWYIHGVSSDGLLISTDATASGSSFLSKVNVLLNDIHQTSTDSYYFALSFSNDTTVYVAPCFAEGTRLTTARGAVAVEDLVEGDEVVTASGAARPVIWIGSRQVRCDRHPAPALVNPVRVRAGAFADGVPSRDLRLSPGHAVWLDGVLVPVGLLTNGATIVQEPVETVRYFHIELDAHDVVLAEGLACESYLDDGNRETFGNAPGHLDLYGRLDPQDWDQACAPVLRDGPALQALADGLRQRALAQGWTLSHEPLLTLEADGVALVPVFSAGPSLWFVAPAARDLVLRSPSAVPALVTPGLDDHRPLGVALAGLRINGQAIDLASDQLSQGFHPPEARTADDGTARSWRWTDGAGRLPSSPASTMIEIAVSMVSPRWVAPDQAFNQASPFAPRLRLVEAG
uniref:Hedgehog/Intein (Hint) domain-containing protein n=1 Tax=Caulobacter sp. (strain K31) TaxID=366602 RepID=B0T7Q3_CAUSK